MTGQEFDIDAKTFTLGNMFNMQLHKFAEEIGKITNAAVRAPAPPLCLLCFEWCRVHYWCSAALARCVA